MIVYTGGSGLHRQAGVIFLPHHMASCTTRQHLHTITLSRATRSMRCYFVFSSLTTRAQIVLETSGIGMPPAVPTARRRRGSGVQSNVQNTKICSWFFRIGFPSSDRKQYCGGLGRFAHKYTEAHAYRVSGGGGLVNYAALRNAGLFVGQPLEVAGQFERLWPSVVVKFSDYTILVVMTVRPRNVMQHRCEVGKCQL
jgi:hypothetical protein